MLLDLRSVLDSDVQRACASEVLFVSVFIQVQRDKCCTATFTAETGYVTKQERGRGTHTPRPC